MKRIFLVRHAKSSWDDPGLPDRERPLSERGKRDARRMAERLGKREVRPEAILSSPASRALATALIVGKELGFELDDIVTDARLYTADADGLLDVIQSLSDKHKSVMLFGHNPALTELAHRWSAQIVDMPTCAVAEFGFDTKSWSLVGQRAPSTAALTSPKTA